MGYYGLFGPCIKAVQHPQEPCMCWTKGPSLSAILFLILTDVVSRCCQGAKVCPTWECISDNSTTLQAGMRIGSSKSEAVVPCWKTLDCLLWLCGERLLSQATEFTFLGLLFSDGEIVERQFGMGMQALYWTIVVKKELTR